MLPVCLCVAVWAEAGAENVVRNPGFEEGTEGPENWIFWARTTGKGAWDATVAHSGQRSVRVDGVADGNQNWAQQNIPLRPGWLHRVGAWVRQERCYSWGPDIVVVARDADGQVLESWSFRGRPGTRQWYFVEGYFLAPANAVQASVELRVLHLSGTAWFDDVSLVAVGPWQAPVSTADPAAAHEARLAYLQKLSTEVQTPHWDWAEKVYDSPTVLFLLDRIGQRETVELAQRFGFPWRAVAVSVEAYPQYQTGEYYDSLSHGHANDACLRALSESAGVIVVSGSVWTAVSGEVRRRVLESVSGGATLVYMGCPKDWSADDGLWQRLGVSGTGQWVQAVPEPSGEGLLSCWPAALPPMQVHKVVPAGGRVLAQARADDGTLLPLLVENSYGAGRTLYVAYMSEAQTWEVRGPGLTPFFAFREVEDLAFPYQEYLLASVMKWLMIGSQPGRWKTSEISAVAQGERVTGRVVHAPAPEGMVVRWTWRGGGGQPIQTGRKQVPEGATETALEGPQLAAVPGGRVFLEAVFDGPAGTFDWAAACTAPRGPYLKLDLDRPVCPEGAAIKGSVRIEGLTDARGPRAPLSLTIELWDCYGWLWESQRVAVEDTAAAPGSETGVTEKTFNLGATRRMRASGGWVWARLTDAAGTLLAEKRRRVVFSPDRSWDDWHQHLWSVFGRSGYREYMHPYLAAAARDMGIDTLLFNMSGEEWHTGASYDFRLIPIGIWGLYSTAYGHNEYAETGDRKYLIRPGCPSSSAEQENLLRAVSDVAGLLAPYSPATYCMSDENNLTYFNSSFDYCFCEHCLAGMREWLKVRWGDLASLNAAWGTNFSSWEEVVPDTFEEAVARGRFVSWADHRAFMDRVFAQVWRQARDVARAADPGARVSISGTPEPAAYGGYDWYQLLQSLDALLPYLGTEVGEMQRSWTAIPRAPWSAGYGSRGPALSFGVWRAVFNGCRGIGVFWQPSMIEPDFTLPQCSRDLERVSRPLRQGLGKLIIAARPAPPRVALYHSMPSIRAAYVHGLEVEQADQLKGLVTGLQVLGIPFAVVDGRQVEQGWLLQHRPAVLFLPVALAMSDKELQHIEEYVEGGGRVIFDLPPALYDDRLASRDALGPSLLDLLGQAGGGLERPTDELLALPVQSPWREQARGKSRGAGRLLFARYYRDLQFRSCPAMEDSSRQCEDWLLEALRWAGVQPMAQARWGDGGPVRDCLWASWDLAGGRLIAVLRQPGAASKRTLRVNLGGTGAVYDVLGRRKLPGSEVTAVLGPGDVALWAVLSKPIGAPRLKVVRGALKAGTDCQVEVSVPGAPDPAVVRLEIHGRREDASSLAGSAWSRWPTADSAAGKGAAADLPGLARNVLLSGGRASITVSLPQNLPPGAQLVLREVISGQETRAAIGQG
ncbi:MAG: beta-galactosidase [Armatimonadetes bacterium]|nr:beta-galactosidase [Armatimonadota bacterium]